MRFVPDKHRRAPWLPASAVRQRRSGLSFVRQESLRGVFGGSQVWTFDPSLPVIPSSSREAHTARRRRH